MRNIINTKKRTWMNTVGWQLLQAVGCWLLFLLLLMLWISKVGDAEGAEMEISAGRTTYQKADNGIFWQNGFENEFQLQSNSIGIGFTGYLSESVRYHTGYMDLGWVSSYAKALPKDENYDGVSGCVGKCHPLAQWHGSGKVEGVYYTVAPEMVFGQTKVFVEVGGWAYQATHSMIIPDTTHCTGCQTTSYHFIHARQIDYGLVFGAGVEYKNTQFVVTMWQSNVNGIDPNTDIGFFQGYTTNVMLRQRF